MCVAQVFAKVGKLLSDGRQFLCAGHFTAADLAFAALAYPVLMPQPAFAYLLPPLEEFPAEVRTAVELRRETAAGKFAMRLYRQHRFPRASNMHRIVVRTGSRNRVPMWLMFLAVVFFISVGVLVKVMTSYM